MLSLFATPRPADMTKKLVLQRLASFVLAFSVLPFAAAFLAAIRGSSRFDLLWEPLKTDPRFSALIILQPALASVTIAALLAGASLFAWPLNAKFSWLRTVRLFLLFCLVGYFTYPAFGSTIPIVRTIPLWVMATLLVVAVSATYLLPFVRPTIREVLFTTTACLTFFADPLPKMSPEEFRGIAGRELDADDVLILGFDSIAYDDVKQLLDGYRPPSGGKAVFANATTPLAMTNVAWRTIFSGKYPNPQSLPGDSWGQAKKSWLPEELGTMGYMVSLIQDDPTTNIFSHTENTNIPTTQGWKWLLQTFAWRTIFPMSELGGSWWLSAFGCPTIACSRYAYSPLQFRETLIRHIAVNARNGPVFVSAHTCFGHTPIKLTLTEVVGLGRWWTRAPRDLQGGVDYFSNNETTSYKEVLDVRTASMRTLLSGMLNRLDEMGMIGATNLFFLSDHGPRASWVERNRAENIMLMTLVPGKPKSITSTAPVSLVDVAPTIRRLLGLPDKASDGQELPLDGTEPSGLRITQKFTPASINAGSRILFNPRKLGLQGKVQYNSDGTFVLSEQLKIEIRKKIESENRTLEGVRRMIEKGQSEMRASAENGGIENK